LRVPSGGREVTPETETFQHARQEMGQVRFVIDDQSLTPGVRSIEWFFMLPTKGSRPHLASDGLIECGTIYVLCRTAAAICAQSLRVRLTILAKKTTIPLNMFSLDGSWNDLNRPSGPPKH
jgi:hypothetical protein